MQIRHANAWCPDCTAPELWQECLPFAQLFLEALPAWRLGGMDRVCEGFDRSEVYALMRLRAIPSADRPAAWALLCALESEWARIRAAARAQEEAAKGPRPAPGVRRG